MGEMEDPESHCCHCLLSLLQSHCNGNLKDAGIDEPDGVVVPKSTVHRMNTQDLDEAPYPLDLYTVEPDGPFDTTTYRSKLCVIDPLDPSSEGSKELHNLGVEVCTTTYFSDTLDLNLYRHTVVDIDENGKNLQLQLNDELLFVNSKSVMKSDHSQMMSTVSSLQPPVDGDLFALNLVVRRCIHNWGEPCIRPGKGASTLPEDQCCQYLDITAKIRFDIETEFDTKVVVTEVEAVHIPGDTITKIKNFGTEKEFNVKVSLDDQTYVWKVNCAGIQLTAAQHKKRQFVFTFQLYEVLCANSKQDKRAYEISFEDEDKNRRHLVVTRDNAVGTQVAPEKKDWAKNDNACPELQPALWVNITSGGITKLEALTKPGFYLIAKAAPKEPECKLPSPALLGHVGDEEYPCSDLRLEKHPEDLVPDFGCYTLLPVGKSSALSRQNRIVRELSTSLGDSKEDSTSVLPSSDSSCECTTRADLKHACLSSNQHLEGMTKLPITASLSKDKTEPATPNVYLGSVVDKETTDTPPKQKTEKKSKCLKSFSCLMKEKD